MTTIFERVEDALTTLSPVPFGMDVFLQTGGAALPATYITYFLVDGTPEAHADNAETMRTYRVQVNIMSTSGLASLPDVDAAMLGQGFTRGPERALPKDRESGHYILAKDYFYLDSN